jgi:hypothetical protein
MTLKNAALLALIGTILMTALFGVEFRLQLAQSAAWLGSCGNAVLVVHLCVWLLRRDGFLFRVP